MRRLIVLSFVVGLSSIMVFSVKAQSLSADLILNNAEVKTANGWVDSIAISDGIIIAIADKESIDSLKDPQTQVIDLNGRTVLPGLHDSHVHPLFAGLEQYNCGFAAAAPPQEIAKTLASCAKSVDPGGWLLGGNWVAAVFSPGQQNRAFLDEVATDIAIVLTDEAHHSVWVNSKALELANITRDTPDPAGGIIERDSLGQPTGLLRESATRLVDRVIPPASMNARRAALTLSTNQMLSYGITSFTVASVRDTDMLPLANLSKEGVIKQRMRGCIVWAPAPDEVRNMGERLINSRARYSSSRYSPDCVKLFLDGVPTESHTGAMLAPYVDENSSHAKQGNQKGFLLIPQGKLDHAVTSFDRQGLHLKFHAAGDGAVRSAVKAIANARKVNGFGGPFHHIGHSTFVDPDDIPMARKLGFSWEFSPYIWYPTPMASVDVKKAVGAERMKRFLPVREAIDTGALVVTGSDWSVVPSVNPWLAMETLVTRQIPGGSKETLGLQESITLEEAFTLMTINGARLMGHSDRVGSIEVGKLADIIVTDKNPFKVPITEVHDIRVMKTYISGELVFDIGNPPRLDAH